jgi:hydroxypyruvate isomerase
MTDQTSKTAARISRRRVLQSSVGAAAVLVGAGVARAQLPREAADPKFRVKNGRIRQSVMGWCFNPMKPDVLARHAKEIGLVAIEGISRDAYKSAKEAGLEISLVSSHGFSNGPCNPKFRDEVIAKLNDAIEVASSIGTKRVITFTGMRFDGMDADKAASDCIDVWKQVLPLAEKKGVTLCLEHLNSRDSSHPMKGHPGYFGDNVDFCVELIRRVGSDHFKLLFDIYHVSIMNGDIIRRIRQYKDVIAHYHTAGNPGRGELDETQEINYPAVMRAILETGYTGFVAQEFIPTWSDPIAALRHSAEVCDV